MQLLQRRVLEISHSPIDLDEASDLPELGEGEVREGGLVGALQQHDAKLPLDHGAAAQLQQRLHVAAHVHGGAYFVAWKEGEG